MTEYLHTKLVDTLKAHGINPALSEDEIDSYPYVTFELPVEYRYTKDGPYKIVGNLTIRSVSDDFDEADALRAGIESAIAQSFGGPANADPAEEAGGEEEEVSEVMPADPDEETDPTEEPADPAVDPGEKGDRPDGGTGRPRCRPRREPGARGSRGGHPSRIRRARLLRPHHGRPEGLHGRRLGHRIGLHP